jgi:LuxR family maltose regulon positive regulatory protein
LEARGEFARGEALLRRVLEATAPGALRNTPVLARLEARLGRLILRQGRADEAHGYLQRGLEHALACADLSAFHAYLGLAELAMGQGDLATAFARLAQAERQMQRQRVSESLYRGALLLASSHLWMAQGHLSRAQLAATRVLGYAQRVKAILPTPHFPELIPRFQALLHQLAVAQGDDRRLALRQLLDQALLQGRQALACDLWRSYAQACTAAGDTPAAEQARQAGHALQQRLGYHWACLHVGAPADTVSDATPASSSALSSREVAVLSLIAQGLSNQEVAERLFISLHTVKTHARRINGKLGVARRTQAVAKAKELGFF